LLFELIQMMQKLVSCVSIGQQVHLLTGKWTYSKFYCFALFVAVAIWIFIVLWFVSCDD